MAVRPRTRRDAIILFFVESQHCRSVGSVMQRWELLDDYTVNTIADAMPEDERSVNVILRALSRFVILTTNMTSLERYGAAGAAFHAAVEEHFERRCMEALLAGNDAEARLWLRNGSGRPAPELRFEQSDGFPAGSQFGQQPRKRGA